MQRFYILGCQRSGTTLLRLILECHPKVFCLDELKAYLALRDKKKGNASKSDLVGYKIPAWTEQLTENWLYEPSQGLWAQQFYKGEPILFLHRDAKAVVHSMMDLKWKTEKSNWWHTWGEPVLRMKLKSKQFRERYRHDMKHIDEIGTRPIAEAALYWKFKTQAYFDYLKLGWPICGMRYEELVTNPKQELKRVLKFLSLEWDERILSHSDYSHSEIYSDGTAIGGTDPSRSVDKKSLKKWKNSLSNSDVKQIDLIAGDLNSAVIETLNTKSRSNSKRKTHSKRVPIVNDKISAMLDWLVERDQLIQIVQAKFKTAEQGASALNQRFIEMESNHRQKIEAQQGDLEDLKNELKQSTKKSHHYQNEKEQLEESCFILNKEVESLKNDISTQEAMLTGRIKEIDELRRGLETKDQFLVERAKKIEQLESISTTQQIELVAQRIEIEHLENKSTAQEKELVAQKKELVAQKKEIEHFGSKSSDQQKLMVELKKEIKHLESKSTAQEKESVDKRKEIKHLENELSSRSANIAAQEEEISTLNANLSAVYNSTSWKFSAPLRAVKNLIVWGIKISKRLIKLLYLAVTLQLFRELRCRKVVRTIVRSGLFDSEFYLSRNPDVSHSEVNPVLHYVVNGAAEHRDPSPLFDTAYYLEKNPDIAELSINPLFHYIEKGAAEGRDPNSLFDTSYYFEKNPDVVEAGFNPLLHYIRYGAAEERDPIATFDTSYYLEQNPDVAETGVNPLGHYLMHGVLEGRLPKPSENIAYLEDTTSSAGEVEIQSFTGAAENSVPTKRSGIRSVGLSKTESSLFVVEHAIQVAQQEKLTHENLDPKKIVPSPMQILAEIRKREIKERDVRKYYTQRSQELFKLFLCHEMKLGFPEVKNPKVSIILILYNKAELTYMCLKSILQTVELTFEIIIVDNASTDETGSLLDRLKGARIIRNAENMGFLKAVNQGLEIASGDNILLLNNDTQLFPGALKSAVSTLESDSSIGAVGGRIVSLDGKLQEAGSIIWNDGSCFGYGRGDDPDQPAYLFRRDIDYCSGAFLLVRRHLFLDLNGFDELFSPAYYEETDLCMRLWEKGYRVVYEPNAVILHYEFASSSSRKEAVKLQLINRQKFLDKYRIALSKHCSPSPEHVLIGRLVHRTRRRILVLDDRIPHRKYGSGFPRANDIIHSLVELCFGVTFYPVTIPIEESEDLYVDLPREVEIIFGQGATKLAHFLRERADYYDTIWVSRPHNMSIFNKIYARNPKQFESTHIIYDAEAIFAIREISKARLSGLQVPPKETENQITAEVDIGKVANRVITVSDAEEREFRNRGNREVYVLGHQLTPRPTKTPFKERKGILFVGAMHGDDTPNADSVKWFVKHVWPHLQKDLLKEWNFIVAGANNAPSVWALRNERIQILGFVEDLTYYYKTCRIFVIPTRYAAGIPYKAHEAASFGLPLVTTSLIADQLGWKSTRDLLSADTPEDFASKCLSLCTKEKLWHEVRDNALTRVREDCSEDYFTDKLALVLKC